MRNVPLKKIEEIITFHGEVFPDNPNRMFREGRLTGVPEPTRDVDVVIVGGGAAGLTAAYRLRDRNILLLEALPEIGGNSTYSEWEGIPFSLGGQYIGAPGTWADPVWDLCRELNLTPQPDTSPLVLAFPNNIQTKNPYSLFGFIRMPLPWRVKRDIVRFYLLDMPKIDVENRKEELDRTPFSEFLKKYSPEFRRWYDGIAKPYPSVDGVSAYYAITSAQDEDYAGSEGICSFPGGLGLITRTLAQKINEKAAGRLLTGAFVYKVRRDDDGRVLATYWQDGNVTTVRARAAVVSAEANIAKQIIEDIPNPTKDAMNAIRRFSYPTFTFCSREPIYRTGYRVGVMHCAMQAVTVPDWFSRDKGPNRPNIFTCFNKMAPEHVDLVQDRDAMLRMAARMLGELDLHFPGAIEKVKAIHAFCRTMNYCVPYPGYMTDVLPNLGKPFDNIFFANAEYVGPVTRFPEAVISADKAAEQVKHVLDRD
jgi:glycine/D-amino acid oxidase-like deaminating enzyme